MEISGRCDFESEISREEAGNIVWTEEEDVIGVEGSDTV
jgi:hypothetical protein